MSIPVLCDTFHSQVVHIPVEPVLVWSSHVFQGRGPEDREKDERDRLWGQGPYGAGREESWHTSLTHFACFKSRNGSAVESMSSLP